MIETGSAIDALERLNLVLSADPHNTRALELKARIEVEQGDFDAALASYQRLCYQKTMSVSTLLALGDLYLTRHQPDRAAPLFRMAIVDAHATPEDQLVAQWRLGVAYFQAERWSEAADQLSRRSSPDHERRRLAHAGSLSVSLRRSAGRSLLLERRLEPATQPSSFAGVGDSDAATAVSRPRDGAVGSGQL
ncbi:MAG: tetratricopeptide repeat protein [Planctomycetaceae bacterium]